MDMVELHMADMDTPTATADREMETTLVVAAERDRYFYHREVVVVAIVTSRCRSIIIMRG